MGDGELWSQLGKDPGTLVGLGANHQAWGSRPGRVCPGGGPRQRPSTLWEPGRLLEVVGRSPVRVEVPGAHDIVRQAELGPPADDFEDVRRIGPGGDLVGNQGIGEERVKIEVADHPVNRDVKPSSQEGEEN